MLQEKQTGSRHLRCRRADEQAIMLAVPDAATAQAGQVLFGASRCMWPAGASIVSLVAWASAAMSPKSNTMAA